MHSCAWFGRHRGAPDRGRSPSSCPTFSLATVSRRLRQFVNQWPFNNARHAPLSNRLSIFSKRFSLNCSRKLMQSRDRVFFFSVSRAEHDLAAAQRATSVTRSKRHALLPFTDNGQGRSFQFLFARLFTRSESTATKYIVDTTMFRSWCRQNG